MSYVDIGWPLGLAVIGVVTLLLSEGYWLLLGAGLLFVSRIMYTTLVHYTGAAPSEHFSVQKRPEYKKYQRQTNMFFPGPVKP